jgi:hypothetical protein
LGDVELEQSPAVVMANTGDSPATILKYYAKLPEIVMRRFVDSKPVIPREQLELQSAVSRTPGAGNHPYFVRRM